MADAIGICPGLLDIRWWATDFHFDWLAGALLTFMNGETFAPQENPPDPQRLVMGNQEDLDLVVVARDTSAPSTHHLVLIEAKAYGYFTNKQWGSKVARLERLFAFYKGLERNSVRRVCFHYVLYSPNKPTRLNKIPLPWQSGDREETAPVRHIQLKLALPASSMLAVSRCNDTDELDAKGEFWRCVKLSDTNPVAPENAIEAACDAPSPEGPVSGIWEPTPYQPTCRE